MVMTQLSLKAAPKQWVKDTKVAAEAEAKQLHGWNSLKPVHWKEVNKEKQKQSLSCTYLLRRSAQAKSRPARLQWATSRETSSVRRMQAPTVATESVLLTSLVNAQENHDVAIADIPNTFIQTVVKDNKDKVVMRIRGHMVDVLVKVAPKVYSPYVSTDKQGRKQLLVECLNAIYGTMVASFLYYWKFTRSLKNQGYRMNPYDPCVWNKIMEKKQITICFHVDDCKVSHKPARVVDEAIK
jgi:hypothetical protein